MIADGRFREDLYFRLNVIEIALPPLARRPADILPLARAFLTDGKQLGGDAESALKRHVWPGNVRELKNVIQRACLLAPDPVIHGADLALPASPPAPRPHDANEDTTREQMEQALREHDGKFSHAAGSLGLVRQALYRRMDRLGIER